MWEPPVPDSIPAGDPSLTPVVAVPIQICGTDSELTSSVRPPVSNRYVIGEQIARGGMGTIHVANDTAFNRVIAVKVLLPGSGAGAARQFANEARITAQLQHPGIPPVHDLGSLPDGRPFLAMKLIKGQTLADLLSDGADRDRLVVVFEGIVQAVAYAHEHGAIHRDLKPTNIMVGAFGEVQVMDWGLAKIVGCADGEARAQYILANVLAHTQADSRVPQTEHNDHTQNGEPVGTPAYIPPEQARGAVADIDRRSDVFGLGALLCVILTGRPPFIGTDATATLAIASRGDLDDAFRRLDSCRAEPDLLALCKRCISADRDARPADAGEVAVAVAEIRRAADARARAAGEERERRRQRNMLGGLAAALLLAGAVGVAVQWRRAEVALALATAQERATQAALDRESTEMEGKAAALADAERVRGQAVASLRAMTDEVVTQNIARKPELAEDDRRFLRQVLELWQTVAVGNGNTEEGQGLRAEGLFRVALVQQKLGDTANAEAAYRQAAALQEMLAAKRPDRTNFRKDLAATLNNLGVLLAAASRTVDAEAAYCQATALQMKLVADFPSRPDYRQELALTYTNRGALLRAAGRVADAEVACRSALALQEMLVAEFPARPDYRLDLGRTKTNLGVFMRDVGRTSDSEAAYRAAVDVYRKLAADFPARPDYRQELALTYTNLGILLRATGRAADAGAACRNALALQETLAAEFPSRPDYRLELGGSCGSFGRLLLDTGNPVEALNWFAKAVAVLAPIHAANPSQATAKRFLRNSFLGQARTLDRLGRHTAAMADWDRVLDLSPLAERPTMQASRANALMQAGQVDRAVAEVADLTNSPQQWTANQWYDFACVCAVASGKLADKREEHATRAIELARKAVAAGYRDRGHMLTDPDLAALRGRADFQAVLNSLPELAPPPRPVR